MYNFVVFISDQERKKRNTHIHTFIKEKKERKNEKIANNKISQTFSLVHFCFCVFVFEIGLLVIFVL